MGRHRLEVRQVPSLPLGGEAVLAVLNYVGDSTVEGLISRYNELRLGAQGWAWLPVQSGDAIREQLRRLIRLGLGGGSRTSSRLLAGVRVQDSGVVLLLTPAS